MLTVEDIQKVMERASEDQQILRRLSAYIKKSFGQVKRDIQTLRSDLNRVRAILIVVVLVVVVLSFALGFLAGRATAPKWYLLRTSAIQPDRNGGAWVYLAPLRRR